ncbi:hypothetical protein IU459_13315 [Nocardia amamiensis]|uniref:TetR family transcriptional regulator n=1 Tax=Nocardia amamiensis TaxID=404578 RepID=A0ABS0CUI4_9NOCA|nr:hypothetical protein [Nocardia amamiensis]MBF6298514.1 hypothetical protein [Nocardia amamiensis]
MLGDRIADDRNAQLAAQTVVPGIFDVTALWLRRELDVDRDQFIEFIVAMIITGSTITDAVSPKPDQTWLGARAHPRTNHAE